MQMQIEFGSIKENSGERKVTFHTFTQFWKKNCGERGRTREKEKRERKKGESEGFGFAEKTFRWVIFSSRSVPIA